jgi:hypothetical protein
METAHPGISPRVAVSVLHSFPASPAPGRRVEEARAHCARECSIEVGQPDRLS